MKRLIYLVFVALVLISLPLFAEGSKEPATKAASQEQKFAGKTIVLQGFLNPAGKTPREVGLGGVIEGFKKKTGIDIKTILFSWDENDPQLILAVQSGNPPDVSFIREKSFETHMSAGTLIPLDDYISRDFDQQTIKDYLVWDLGKYKGKKYNFNTSFVAWGLLIRKDLLDKTGLGVPKTWEDFIKVAKAIKAPGIDPFLFGASSAQTNQMDYLQPILEGRGARVLDDSGMAVFDSPKGIETFAFLRSLMYEHKILPEHALTSKYDDMTDAFAAGKIGMIIEGSHRFTRAAGTLGTKNVVIARIPGAVAGKESPTPVNGWRLGIPKGSKQPDAAWEFIKYFTSPEGQLTYSKLSGEIPVRASVYSDPFFESEQGKIIRWWKAYLDENSSPVVGPPKYAELSEIICTSLQETLKSPDSDVAKILAAGAKRYNAIR